MSLGLILLIVLLLLLVGHRFQAEVKAMTNSDVRKLFSSAATPDIEETLVEMCLPFGAIHHWTVEIDDDGLHRCAVQLDEPGSNEAAARTLGGQLQGTTLHLDIRVR